MNQNNNEITSSIAWSFLERFSSQGISVIISIILARIILPEEYGIVAAVTIFTNIATVFVTGGFSSALIQNKNADDLDYSSMFFFNIVFSVFLFGIVFVSAPFLVRIMNENYDYELLTLVLRLLGIGVVFASFNSFYRAKLMKEMKFKVIFIVSIIGASISAMVGVTMAFLGYGVWALVAQNLVSYFFNGVLFVCLSKWKPKIQFSFTRLKPMLVYGSKLVASSLLTTLYSDVNSLVVGNQYDTEDLAYYSKGVSYPKLIVANILSAINTALFPAMVKMQTQQELRNCVQRFNKFSTFLICPLMFGFAAIAPSFISLLLTDKWAPCVIFLQLSCLNYVLQPLGLANLQYWKASGRATLYLVADIVKKVVGLVFLAVALFVFASVESIIIAEVLATIVGVIINVMPSKKFINYSLWQQIKDVGAHFLLSLVMFLCVWGVGYIWKGSLWIVLPMQILLGMMLYIGGAKMFKMPELTQLWCFLIGYLKKR